MKALSILVADDEEDIRELLRQWLAADGHQVIGVGNATEAGRVMQKVRFDLVVTDILMPDGDGLQLIAKFRTLQPEVRILAISGGGRYMERNDCLRLAKGFGADAVAFKPFKRDDFLQYVVAALGGTATTREQSEPSL